MNKLLFKIRIFTNFKILPNLLFLLFQFIIIF